MSWQPTDRYWAIWFVGMFLAFLIPAVRALVTGHPEHTLSASIWRLEGYRTHGWGWNAFRFLFAGALLWFDVWLYFHFVLRKFT